MKEGTRSNKQKFVFYKMEWFWVLIVGGVMVCSTIVAMWVIGKPVAYSNGAENGSSVDCSSLAKV